MTAVTNSGPLMALAKIGALHTLADTFESVLMPSAVYGEVVLAGRRAGLPDALAVQALLDQGHLRLMPVQSGDMPSDIRDLPLDAGEKEAIHVARIESAGFVLLDDARARLEAKALGFISKGPWACSCPPIGMVR